MAEAIETVLRHTPYVNARGELIANGTNRDWWCGWPHRENCPLCQAMWTGKVKP